jgi:hypothetical protein
LDLLTEASLMASPTTTSVSSLPSTSVLTRVEQTYQQLRNDVPQLRQLPSVLIHMIAEYGPPSLWIVYSVEESEPAIYALYPAAVIETVDISLPTTSPLASNITQSSSPTTISPSFGWSSGWQKLSIHPHIQPPNDTCSTNNSGALPKQNSMEFKEWAFDEWILDPQPYRPRMLHIPHDQPVTKAWAYPLPSYGYRDIFSNLCCWRYDTGK